MSPNQARFGQIATSRRTAEREGHANPIDAKDLDWLLGNMKRNRRSLHQDSWHRCRTGRLRLHRGVPRDRLVARTAGPGTP